MSYVSPQSQRQFVVIAVPSSDAVELSHAAEPEAQRPSATTATIGGYLIAFALPVAGK